MRHKTLRPMKDPRAGYQTRRLQPGDIFELPDTKQGRLIGRVLQARKWATELRDKADVPPPPPAVAAKIAAAVAPVTPAAVGAMTTADMPSATAEDDRPALRAEYERVLGKAPWVGWNTEQLREKIAAAQASS